MVKSVRRQRLLEESSHHLGSQSMFSYRGSSIQQQRLIIRGVTLTLVAVAVLVTFRDTSSMSDSLRILETVSTGFATGIGGSRPPDLAYAPAPVEGYIMNHTHELGFDQKPPAVVPTCFLWKDPLSSPYFRQLQDFYQELKDYNNLLQNFHLPPEIRDVRYDRHKLPGQDACNLVELHPQGMAGIFPKSQQLSFSSSGYVEPLIPPMRHPAVCVEEGVGEPGRLDKYQELVQIKYLIHDWGYMCRKLLPTSRTVFIDMGASLQFHGDHPSPALVLLEQFRRFGIQFDHIYAYEMNPHDPKIVQDAIPKQFKSAYHWINVGVEPSAASSHNPWNLLMDHFHEDDLVVVKLDIDTPAIEHELAHQLLNNPRLSKLVDHFYFEHHVNQKELYPHWGRTGGSVEDSFRLFHGLRKKGVASHFWV